MPRGQIQEAINSLLWRVERVSYRNENGRGHSHSDGAIPGGYSTAAYRIKAESAAPRTRSRRMATWPTDLLTWADIFIPYSGYRMQRMTVNKSEMDSDEKS